MKKQILITIVITASLTFFGTRFFVSHAHKNTGHTEQHEDHGDEHGSEFSYSPEILKEFGIQIGTASGGVLEQKIELPGEIQIDPDRLAHITPRFDGVIKEVFKQMGESVKKDDLLAIIESNESLTTYELHSSMDGVIIDMHFTKGETAQRPDHFFAVADLSEVWVNLSVYQKFLSKISLGQPVKITVNSAFSQIGKISYVSPTLDEHTRTATARVVLRNEDGKFRPGQFITGNVVVHQSIFDVIIPKTALETIDGKSVVFVKNQNGFEPVAVEIGKENQNNVEIISGLNAGQKYVSEGGFILKAQLAKGSFGGGHGH
ncbi:MAG: efflux RND transporter periplasmic adaptor subunit [Candidatus Marinimicrobia bacterium]|nr:efflux RND transporter periplasmic adaptor subunit [Candidatus Neomarinimicrobiota bacterium]